ncbi:hypothetical protein JTE90_005765 [Oedothorax gibbosus]|uniref:Papilin n=1 Tax=Oedothorax gibbosus TaxID=931172 RepID=A0AAV6UT35_9ARAC|nr:hypothetical protein JTE90_005765 [Oedothorax gibbosus]
MFLPIGGKNHEYCFLAQDPGPCNTAEVNWYYDSSDGVCKEFYYGGCRGNQNRFKTRKECETSCFKAQDVCSLSMVKGACSGTFTQWYYDKDKEDCLEFVFTGCQGNANRFNSKESCYQRCRREKLVTTQAPVVSDDVCLLPQEPGPCVGYYPMFYYDPLDNNCKSFVYSGCEGNGNRFAKRAECEGQCIKKTVKVVTEPPRVFVVPQPDRTSNEDVCRLPVEPGPCKQAQPRWFYDAQTQSCLPFVFGGCGGNTNRFKTSEICLKFCTGIKATRNQDRAPASEVTTTTTAPSLDGCAPSNCADIQCPYGIEESFDINGCSSCRCSNPCEVHSCPDGSRCAIDVVRTSRESIRSEPVCRRIVKPGSCPSQLSASDCESRCRDDADCRGEHKCCSNGCAFHCVPPEDDYLVPATQPEPARILPGPNVTEGKIGEPAELPCNAIGWPKPTVTWWRETTMLPLASQRYEQLPNYALLIRSVVHEDGGGYSCHAHNGIGSGSIFKVTLIIDIQAPPYGVEDSDFSARDSEPAFQPLPPLQPFPNAPTLSTHISLATSSPTAGAPLQLDCNVTGPPTSEVSVTWRRGGEVLLEDERRRMLSNHTLLIAKAEVEDGGMYECVAQHGGSVASSAVAVEVKPAPEDTSCIDNPQFSNCELIVQTRYCNNKFYGKYCCASCTKAGQLQSSPPHE